MLHWALGSPPAFCSSTALISRAATYGQVLPDAQRLRDVTALRMERGHVILGLT